MGFFKFLGVKANEPDETETIKSLIRRMEGMNPQVARYHALFACVLCRVARADLKITEKEIREMESILVRIGQMGPAVASLVIEIAKVQNELLGGVEDYLFTREFCAVSTPEQRIQLLECLFAVAAAEDDIDSHENATIRKIADELQIERQDFVAIRSGFRDSLKVLKII